MPRTPCRAPWPPRSAPFRGSGADFPLRPWLFRVAHNEAISITRRQAQALPEPDFELASPSAHADLEERERLRELVDDLGSLSERKRGALVMRELSGLSYAEIASALSVSEGAARQSVYEAREAMREAQLGRDVDCLDIRRIISERDGRKLRGRQTRAHLRACEGCRDFQLAIKQRQGDLQLIAPPMSAAAATALLGAGGALGGGAGGLAGAGGAATGRLAARQGRRRDRDRCGRNRGRRGDRRDRRAGPRRVERALRGRARRRSGRPRGDARVEGRRPQRARQLAAGPRG